MIVNPNFFSNQNAKFIRGDLQSLYRKNDNNSIVLQYRGHPWWTGRVWRGRVLLTTRFPPNLAAYGFVNCNSDDTDAYLVLQGWFRGGEPTVPITITKKGSHTYHWYGDWGRGGEISRLDLNVMKMDKN